MNSGGSDYYAAHDAQGSVVALTSSNGTTDSTFTYDPYGNPISMNTASGAPNVPIRYDGEYLDPTGLYHLAARQYDATSGQFLTTDPLAPDAMKPAMSSYIFVSDRPTTLEDPTGQTAAGGGGMDCAMLGQDTCQVGASDLAVYGPHGLSHFFGGASSPRDAASGVVTDAASEVVENEGDAYTHTNVFSTSSSAVDAAAAAGQLGVVTYVTNRAQGAYSRTYSTVGWNTY